MGRTKGMLPARPLGLAVDRRIPRHASRQDHCKRFGVTDRAVRSWLNGESKTVKFDVADTVLWHLRLNWWDVWDEVTVPDRAELEKVRFYFEGEELPEQLELAA